MRCRKRILSVLLLPALSWAAAPVIELGAGTPGNAPVTLAASQPQQGSLEQRVATIERMLEARNQVQIRLQQQVDSMQAELSELRGLSEEQQYQLQQILNRQRELYREIEQQLQQGAPAAAVPDVDSGEPTGQTMIEFSTDQDENQSYDRALNLVLKEKRYDEATAAFRDFLNRYPDSVYVANAHYWLGQLLYTQGDMSAAKASFTTVVEKYTASNKRADAMLKLGLIADKQGDKATARTLLDQVVQEYPGSTSARLATEQLNSLKSQP